MERIVNFLWIWNDSDKRFTLMTSTQIINTRLFRVCATNIKFHYYKHALYTLNRTEKIKLVVVLDMSKFNYA